MTIAVPAAAFEAGLADARRARWQRHGALLTASALLLLILFRGDARDLAHLWWTSTTFGHCLFIGPVIAWLVWQRRAELAQLDPVGWWPGLVLVAVGGFGWLLGDAAGVALARHLGLVMMLQGAVVSILGPNVARGLAFPLGYALFLVPFGEGLEEPLQRATVAMIMPLLHLTGVPAVVDGVLITIPNGYFEVAEACSGAKFVIAMVAYGALVANVCFMSWSRRAIFMVVAVVVPVIANGLRAFGTIYAAHLTSVAQATGVDHIVYGWVFFGLVMAAVLGLGWRWFDRAPDDAAFNPADLQSIPARHADGLVAALLVVTIAAIFPVWAGAIAARTDVLPDKIALPAVAGWQRALMSTRAPWSPYHPGADHFLIGRYVDGTGAAVDLSIAVFSRQHEGKELVSFGTGALREEDRWVRINDLPDIAGGAAMRVTAPGAVERVIVRWYRVGDVVTSSDTMVKLETVKARLLGGRQRAVAVYASAEVLPGVDPRATIERFVRATGPIDTLADRSAGIVH